MPSGSLVVLGVDPGLTCAGYGVVVHRGGSLAALDFGAIRAPKGAVAQRLSFLFDELTRIIQAHRPDAVAIERVLFNSNTRTAMSVGQAAGIALLAAARAGCEVAEYTPGEVKQTVSGYGKADKSQVQVMIGRLLRLSAPPAPPDAADALGLAITHVQARKLKRMEAAGA